MKKLFALLLAMMMVLSLAACGGGDDEKTPSNEDKTPSSSQQQTQTSKPDESKPADSQLPGEEKSPAEKADEIAVGFGNYNGQSIVWRVLDIDDENEKALLVTKDIVALMAFAEGTETWEDSLVRQWLNNDFINEAFTDEEAAIILSTDITIAPNAEYGTSGGNSTTDKVFLLSEAEVNSYFIDGEARRSNYNGELEDWWTITSGEDETSILIVMGEGTIFTDGYSKQQEEGVRPAIWVNLSDEQADPVEDEPEDKGGTDADGWPVADYITAGMKYTGAGKIVDASTWKQDDTIVVWRVYFDAASVDEVAAYIDALKAEGFTYWPLFDDEEEQAAGTFSTFGYEWQAEIANGPYVEIQHYEEPTDEFSGVDLAQLKIVLYSENPNA